jgi:hypothetical protein
MARELRTFQPLEGDAAGLVSAFSTDPTDWLPDPERDPEGGWIVTVHGGSMSRQVRALLGQPWTVTRTTWRALSWEPINSSAETGISRVLPPLDGELGIHVDESARATLILDARYLPPGGLLGAAVDAVAMHRVARQTGQRLLQDVGVGLSRIASEWDSPQHAGTAPGD